MRDRDERLTKSMGICWHGDGCKYHHHKQQLRICPIDFSTWEGFGKLWGWVKVQDWWETFKLTKDIEVFWDPTVFANAVDDYLQGR